MEPMVACNQPHSRLAAVRAAVLDARLLALLHGVLLTAAFFLHLHASYEDRLFARLSAHATGGLKSEEDRVVALVAMAHELGRQREPYFAERPAAGLRERWFNSGDAQLLEASQACGSYSHLLGRLIDEAGFDFRIAQMKCGEFWACHIFVEAEVDGRWVSLDAQHNLVFRRADGMLATAGEIGADWPYYSLQVPAGYPEWFRHEGVRHTNWGKYPVVMPFVKGVLRLFLGDEVETLSLRALALNKHRVYLNVTLAAWLFLAMLTALRPRLLRCGHPKAEEGSPAT